MRKNEINEKTIEDMKSYYEARASEYDEWFCRRGRYDYGDELNNRWHADATVVL